MLKGPKRIEATLYCPFSTRSLRKGSKMLLERTMIKQTIVQSMKSLELHSLQYLAALRVAILACESEDVQYMIKSCRKTIGKNRNLVLLDSQWKKVSAEVKRKLNQIDMPGSVIDVALENLWPIVFEIFKWVVHHAEDTGIDGSSGFCWTRQVRIDYAKTAEVLVKNGSIDVKKRFKLACFYCLYSEVRFLWEEMSLAEKRIFFIRGNLNNSDQNPIVLYWTYCIQEVPLNYWGSTILNHKHLFRYAVQNGYLCATKFFLDKLKTDWNRMVLHGVTIHSYDLFKPKLNVKEQLDIACFLFCNHIEIPPYISIPIYLILLYFLEWPMQKHFMKVVNRVRQCTRHFIYEIDFACMLEAIIEKELKDFKDYDYKALFIEFWHQFPEYKTYVNANSEVGFKIFMKFVQKHFGFIFKKDSFFMKTRFRAVLFQKQISENVTYFRKGNVDFFKFLILERVTIKSEIARLTNRHFYEYSNLPLGELMHLIDVILETV